MSSFFASFLSSYLLMPILAAIFGFFAYFLAKKNKLLRNKKLIFFVLLGSVVLSLPGLFGFIDYWFMPYVYILLQILYLVLGWYAIRMIKQFLPTSENGIPYYMEFFICFLMMFIGAAFFSLIFNLCNELKYGLWACTCLLTFLFPSLLAKTYAVYMLIPLEIHNVWKYSNNEDLSSFELMDYNKLMVMELEIFKRVNDLLPSKVKAKAPDNMPFGIWFQKFLTDYNLKFPRTPIDVMDQEAYGWIFYVKRSFFRPRKYINAELSIVENKIKEKHTIIAKRVNEHVDLDSAKVAAEGTEELLEF